MANKKSTRKTRKVKLSIDYDLLPAMSNGITKANETSMAGQIWKGADSISNKEQRFARASEVLDLCKDLGIDSNKVSWQFARWRKFTGAEKMTFEEVAKACSK